MTIPDRPAGRSVRGFGRPHLEVLQVGVSANKGEPCAGKCSLGGEVVVGGVGEDGCYAMSGGNGEQRREGFAGVAVSSSGRC
jgi:hypothetical protein